MTTRLRPSRLFSRRARARMSMTVRLGLSSMKMGASLIRLMALPIFGQSASRNLPVRIRLASTRASEESRRWVSSMWLISSEKRSTGFLSFIPALATMPEGERRLPHGGAGPDHDEIGRLQAGQLLVEIGVAGGQARDRLAPAEELLEVVEAVTEQLPQRGHRVDHPALGHVEDQALGVVQHLGDVLGNAVAELGDLTGHRHQPTEQGLLLDDLGVVLGVADRRGVGLEGDEHRGSPMDSSSPRRRSSSVTVTQSAGSPWLNREVMAPKMYPWDAL